MAWPALPELVEMLSDSWDGAVTEFGAVQGSINDAWTHWNAADDHAAIQDILIGFQNLHDAVEYMLCYVWLFDPKTCLAKILQLLEAGIGGDEYELTMSDMINTMLTATPDEVQYMVGINDAYRQSIWDRPYNNEFFAALARGFESWE